MNKMKFDQGTAFVLILFIHNVLKVFVSIRVISLYFVRSRIYSEYMLHYIEWQGHSKSNEKYWNLY